MNGILLINKESGLTSNAVIQKIKRILKVKKIGHAGTLDPLATGLLVVLINQLQNYLIIFLMKKGISSRNYFRSSRRILKIVLEKLFKKKNLKK